MIVITTPTGHIGSKILAKLIKTDEKLRVIAREPSKLSDEVKQKVEVIQGSHADPDALSKALHGADQLFLVVPPSMNYADVNEYYLQFAMASCEAIKEQGVKRVIYVSGTGLGHEKNAGGVSASFLVEQSLEASEAATRILHCGTFMENLLHAVQPIKFNGEFSTSVPADIKLPWVATQDIADVAVTFLLDKTWSGNGSVGVLGPEDLSYGEISNIISEVLGKTVVYKTVAHDELKAKIISFGATEASAQGLIDIYTSMKKGVFNMVTRTPESSSPTTFSDWCEKTFWSAYNKTG